MIDDKILASGQNCLRLVASAVKTASFLGGKPRVATEIAWPRNNGKPLGFIAQLDLGEINTGKPIEWLPDSGRLLFFYDLEEWPWGFDPKDKGGWAVLYDNGADALHQQALPADLNPGHIAPSVKYVSAEPFVSYPDAQRIDSDQPGWSEDDLDEYCDFIENNYGEAPRHQIGGFPHPVQNDDMEAECLLVSNGVYCGDPEGYNSDAARRLRRQENDWRLLFQFDSDDDIQAMWGDLGMLYFWVRETEARDARFSGAWMVLQCS